VNYADVDAVIQAVRFELYRENIYGALEIVEAAHRAHPDPRHAEQARRIRSWLTHLDVAREAVHDAADLPDALLGEDGQGLGMGA